MTLICLMIVDFPLSAAPTVKEVSSIHDGLWWRRTKKQDSDFLVPPLLVETKQLVNLLALFFAIPLLLEATAFRPPHTEKSRRHSSTKRKRGWICPNAESGCSIKLSATGMGHFEKSARLDPRPGFPCTRKEMCESLEREGGNGVGIWICFARERSRGTGRNKS